jgi:transcriptional regulator with XRE-family HTH domain
MDNSGNKNYDELFCKNLIRLRKERKLRQLDLAADADISKSSYRNYELGVFSPTVPVLRRLAKALKVDFNELLGGYPSNREVREKIEDIKSDVVMLLIKIKEEQKDG